MPIDINFGALQPANPFAAYAQGQEIGQKNRVNQARQAAGNIFSSDPDKASQILMGAGDYEAGLTLRKYAKEDRQDRARTATVAKYVGGNAKGAQADAIAAGDLDLAKSIAGMDKDQREQAKANSEQLAALGAAIKDRPYEKRKALILQLKPGLIQHGLDPSAVDGFDPTDANIEAFSAQALGVKGLIEQADKDRNFGLKKDQFTETKRANRTNEGLRAQSNSTAAFSAQTGRMSFDERKRAGGFGTPGTSGVVPDHDVEVDQ